LREHATDSFRELLSAVSTDPAILLYLDGARNNAEQVNENYAREVMELHTMGTGHYDQTDVTEAAKALTGWVVNIPYAPAAQRFLSDYEPWEAVFIPQRHHPHPVTILGINGKHDPSDVLKILLDQSPTAEFVSSKLWIELVGIQPGPESGGRSRRDLPRELLDNGPREEDRLASRIPR
jgi:uncharacterized protein (DUF1800 family)